MCPIVIEGLTPLNRTSHAKNVQNQRSIYALLYCELRESFIRPKKFTELSPKCAAFSVYDLLLFALSVVCTHVILDLCYCSFVIVLTVVVVTSSVGA